MGREREGGEEISLCRGSVQTLERLSIFCLVDAWMSNEHEHKWHKDKNHTINSLGFTPLLWWRELEWQTIDESYKGLAFFSRKEIL